MLSAPAEKILAEKILAAKILAARIWRERGGSVMVEFAFASTLFFLLLLGGFEVGRFMLLHQKLSRVAADSSDLVSRAKDLTAADVQQVFDAASFILDPFELGNDGVLIITSVSTIDSATPRVDWQFDGGGGSSESSEIGATGQPAILPDGFSMRAEENVIFAEVFYNYQPYFGVVTKEQTIYYTGTHRPRFGPLNELQ